MSRSRWQDFLNDHLFWAMDISANKSLPIFTPLFGFSSISAPKIQADVESFKDGTYKYPRYIVKGGSVQPITFGRAASLYDSDFYNWIYHAIEGTTEGKDLSIGGVNVGGFLGQMAGRVRRTIVVFHFSRINLAGGSGTGGAALGAISTGLQAALLTAASGGAANAAVAVGVGVGVGSALGFSVGPFQFATWLPARAWVLHECIPTEYVSGSDFDASSGSISLMSLTVQPSWIEEFSFGIGI